MLSFYTISIRHCTGLRVSMPVHGFGKVIACGVEFVKPQTCRNVLSLRRTIRRRATGVPRAALQAAVGAAGRGAGRGSSVSWEQPGLSAQGSRPAPPASRRRPFPSRGPGQWAKRPRLFRRRLLLGRRVRLRVPGLPLRSGGPQPPPRPVPRGEPARLPSAGLGGAGPPPLSLPIPSPRGAAGPAAAGGSRPHGAPLGRGLPGSSGGVGGGGAGPSPSDALRPQMAPKKAGDGVKAHPIIGRFGTSLKIGIVGLPNVG